MHYCTNKTNSSNISVYYKKLFPFTLSHELSHHHDAHRHVWHFSPFFEGFLYQRNYDVMPSEGVE